MSVGGLQLQAAGMQSGPTSKDVGQAAFDNYLV